MKIALIIVLGVLLVFGALGILFVMGAGKCERDLQISKIDENK